MNIRRFLGIEAFDKKSIKVNFANYISKSQDGMFAFYNNNYTTWQEQQLKHKIDQKFLLCFVFLDEFEWLFVGFYEIVFVEKLNGKGYNTLQITDVGAEFIGRLIVKYDRIQRKELINFENCEDFIQIYEVLRAKQFTFPFRNFNEVKLTFTQLSLIVLQNDQSWKKALSEAKGVYLITDVKTGRLFVGSAYGDISFWDCCLSFVKTGHGGNKTLMKMLAIEGITYAENFQFSILEVKDLYKTDEEIKQREAHWKEILLTREFGYNIV